jgi:CBS domain-containing protein
MRVADLMTQEVVCVRPETTLKEVARLLVDNRISGMPVLDERGRVVGVVSEADILHRESEPLGRDGLLARLFDDSIRIEAEKAAARTAGEAMTAPAITIEGYRVASAAARTMIDAAVNRLPVVDVHGKLLGIVTRADLVRAFVRSDAEIASEIRKDVLERTLWSGPEEVAVSVENGDVTLTGSLETEDDVALLVNLVARVPGVVGVNALVTYRVDERHRSRVHG